MRSTKRTALQFAVRAVWLLGLCGAALGHEMFLEPQTHFPPAGRPTALVNGTFDKSENAIERSRMADVSVASPGGVTHPPESQWHDANSASHFELSLHGEGTHVVGVSTRPRIIELSARDFDAYLEHDGVEDVLKARQTPGTSTSPVKERYSKHVRTFLQVGSARSDDYARRLGYAVEIVPPQNPFDVRVGGNFGFAVLFRGKPAANQLVYASHEGYRGSGGEGGHARAYRLRTSADGTARFEVTRAGRWYVTLIHMQKVDDPEAHYESNWATATFEIR